MGRKVKRLVGIVVLTATMVMAIQSIALACIPNAGVYEDGYGRTCVKVMLSVCR